MLAALVSTTATMCVSPPVFVCLVSPSILLVFFYVFCPALLQLCTPLGSFYFFLVSSPSFWVSLSSFLLLSPLLEPSLLFYLLSVRSLLGAVAVTSPKKNFLFVLSLCGVQLVLRFGVFTILDLDEVDVAPSFVEVFRSVLSGVGGSTGGWRCCWDAPSLPQFPPATHKTHPPTLVCFFRVLAEFGVTSTISGWLEVNLSLSGKRGGKSHHLGTILLSAVSGIWKFCMVI